MRAATLFASACAIVLIAPGAFADAGRPDDAPADWVDAWDVPLGALNGTLGGDDVADWYRVDGSGDDWLVIRAFVPVAGLGLQVRADNGTLLLERVLPKGNTTAVWTHGQVARVGVRALGNASTNDTGAPFSNYSLDLRGFTQPPPPPPEPVADLAITGLRIENVPDLPRGPVTTDMGHPSTGTKRVIHVQIENRGNVSATGTASLAARASQLGMGWSWLLLDTRNVTVLPGETVAFAVPWDATGSIGDVVITADVPIPDDPTPRDNVRMVRHYVVAGGTGIGFVSAIGT